MLHPLLIEREAELESLAAALERAHDGEGTLVAVEGGTGMGRSELVVATEDMALGRGVVAFLARGSELERDLPFGVIVQLLEQHVMALPAHERAALLDGPAGLASSIFPALRSAAEPDVEDPFALVHGVYWLIARLAERRPVLLAVDDVHWIDERSLQALRYVAGRVPDLPVVLLAAGRRDASQQGDPLSVLAEAMPPVRLALQPLSPEGVAKLVLAEFPDAEAGFVEGCARATAGVPLLLHELITAIRGMNLAPSDATGASLERLGPVEVSRAVLTRLEHLPAGTPALARMAAVLGDGAELHHTARLAAVDPMQAAVVHDALVAAGIAEPGETIRFRHPIVRSALEASVPPAGRSLAHLKLAQALLGEAAPPDRVAHHLVAAQRGGRRWVVEVLRRAAARAMADGAPASAAHYLERALAEPPEPGTRSSILLELARAEAAAGSPTASATISAALDEVGDPEERVQAAADLGELPETRGDRSGVVAAYEEALRLARREGADPEAARWLEANLLAEARDDAELRPRARRLLGSAGPACDDTPGGRALLAQRALEAALAGRPVRDLRDLAQHALGRGALLAEDRPGGHHIRAAVRALTYADDLQSAELALAMAIDRARASGSPEAYARVCGLRAGVALRRGSLTDAVADARAAIDASEGAPDTRTVATLATALLERGDDEEAARLLERTPPERADLGCAPPLLVARARVRLATGDNEAAFADATQAGEVQALLEADSPTVLDWRTVSALAVLPADPVMARHLAAAQLDLARAQRVPRALGIALAVAGRVEGGDHGLELLGQAASALADSHALLDRARVFADHGEVLVKRGHAMDGRRRLREALALAGRCGAVALEARIADVLAAEGADVRTATGAGAGADPLTPGERRVVDLATDGLTSDEIADALFLTVKTVVWQLRSACAKLGVDDASGLLGALPSTTRGAEA